MEAELILDEEAPPIPARSRAVVANRSAVGSAVSQGLTFFDPSPCTQGYGNTERRPGEDTSATPFGTRAACTLPRDRSAITRAVNTVLTYSADGLDTAEQKATEVLAGPAVEQYRTLLTVLRRRAPEQGLH